MLTKRTTAALAAIVLASSLIVVIGSGGLAGSAFAAKKASTKPNDDTYTTLPYGQDNTKSPKSQSTNTGDSSEDTGNTNGGLSAKSMKKFNKCVSGATEDGEFRQAEANNCYAQAFY